MSDNGRPTSMTVSEIAELVSGTTTGDADRKITGINRIESAGPSDVTFLSDPKFLKFLSVTEAGCSYCCLRFRIGEPVGRKGVPWKTGGRNPAVQLRVPFLGNPNGSFSTT